MRNLENNTLFLKSSSTEVFKPLNSQKTLYMSNLGRIYSLNNEFFIEYRNKESYLVQNNIKRKSYSIKELQTELFQNDLSMEQKIKYKYFNVDENLKLMDSLSQYIKVSDLFMSYLIDKKIIGDFEKAVYGFFHKNNWILKEDLKNCLLKPIYIRFSYLIHTSDCTKIKDNIKNQKMTDEVVLYDVPCKLKNSELIIFDYLKINLKDYVADSYDELDCIYLGETLFKEIRFKIKTCNVEIIFTKN